MVRAILEGRKTQTRRLVKLPDDILPERTFVDPGNAPIFGPGPYVKAFHMVEGEELMYPRIRCPYGYPGDLLWVRETWCQDDEGNICFRADDWTDCPSETGKWRPSIFLPREFSRITLAIAEVRVERLQDISEADAKAEGVLPTPFERTPLNCYVESYRLLWDSINGKTYPWASNPWVWAINFSRLP
jgi:hypothetical protein